MKISYSILTHNEDKSLQKLLEFLVKHKDEEDEIVILDDYSDNPKTIEILDIMTSMYEMTFEQRHLLKDYAGQKNYLTRMCKNDYIVNIDADEIPHKLLMKNIKPIPSSSSCAAGGRGRSPPAGGRAVAAASCQYLSRIVCGSLFFR